MSQFNEMSRRAFLALPLLLATMPATAGEPPVVGRISRLVGAPSVLAVGAAAKPATPGMTLHEGDRVVTGPGARLEIVGADGTSLTIGERTTVVLTHFLLPTEARRGRGLLELLEGIMRIELPRSWDRFEVKTPTAVASARSTPWLIEATAGDTAVFVSEGSVQVVNRTGAGAVLLYPRFGTDVGRDGLPMTPMRWGQARVDAALARTRIP